MPHEWVILLNMLQFYTEFIHKFAYFKISRSRVLTFFEGLYYALVSTKNFLKETLQFIGFLFVRNYQDLFCNLQDSLNILTF